MEAFNNVVHDEAYTIVSCGDKFTLVGNISCGDGFICLRWKSDALVGCLTSFLPLT